MKTEAIAFTDENGEVKEFFVEEQTRVNGVDYLLVAEEAEGECEALILKDVSAPDDKEAAYSVLGEGDELEAVAKIFAEMLGEDETLA